MEGPEPAGCDVPPANILPEVWGPSGHLRRGWAMLQQGKSRPHGWDGGPCAGDTRAAGRGPQISSWAPPQVRGPDPPHTLGQAVEPQAKRQRRARHSDAAMLSPARPCTLPGWSQEVNSASSRVCACGNRGNCTPCRG